MYIRRRSPGLGLTDLMSIKTSITNAPVSTKSGTTYYPTGQTVQNKPTEPASTTASDIMGAVGGILGALVTPAAAIYSAKLQADAQKSAAKAASQSMFQQAQQPVIIQQSGSSNAPIWIVLGILGVISIGGIVFLLSKQ